MQVFNYQEKANDFSVPFDWDAEDYNIDYLLDEIAEKFFDERKAVGNAWRPTFFGVVNLKQKLGDLGSLVRDDIIVMSQKAVDILRPLIQASAELLPYKTEIGLYYLVNVLDEGDYLDRAQTECDRILPNGLCAGITRFVFDEKAKRQAPISYSGPANDPLCIWRIHRHVSSTWLAGHRAY